MSQIPFSHLATLSRINPANKGITSDGFESVVAYVEKIQKYASDAEPILNTINVVRDDLSISTDAKTTCLILEQFPDKQLSLLKVPVIF